jgi:uncharacterized SAM-binding protein YcdF (DUF218 family)
VVKTTARVGKLETPILKRLKRFFATRLGRFVLVFFAVWAAVCLWLAAQVHQFGQEDHQRPADVLIVLGAGVNDWDNSPTPALRHRSEWAAALWHEGVAPVILCSGGYSTTATASEAEVCRRILGEAGIPADVIFLDEDSHSTLENALFSQQMMTANDWHTAVLVSDGYHLLRARWFFENLGIDVTTTPVTTPYLTPFEYTGRVIREVMALHWQAIIDLFNLSTTAVPLV